MHIIAMHQSSRNAHAQDKHADGPAAVLCALIDGAGGVAPRDWPGYRDLEK